MADLPVTSEAKKREIVCSACAPIPPEKPDHDGCHGWPCECCARQVPMFEEAEIWGTR